MLFIYLSIDVIIIVYKNFLFKEVRLSGKDKKKCNFGK